MSHLGRWSCLCLYILLALGTIKPHVPRLVCEACVRRPYTTKQGEIMLAMPATSVRRKSDCRECQVRLNLLREAFKVPHSLRAAESITTVIR